MLKILSMLSLILLSPSKLFGNALKFESIQHSQVTVSPDIVGVLAYRDRVYETPFNNNYLISSAYNPKPKKDGFAFGDKYSDTAGTDRIIFPKHIKKGYWHGLASYGENILLMEGRKKKILRFKPETKRFIGYSEIILDLFRPALDSRGEPTKNEITNGRRNFIRELKKLDSGVIALNGLAEFPQAWVKGSGQASHLIATGIPKFPLFTMKCSSKDGLVCQLKRQCFLEGHKKVAHGLAVSAKRRQILRVDRENHQLLVYKWMKCHHIPLVGRIKLPAKLNKARNLYIDSSDNLWVSTEKPDNYRNSSLYKWAAKDWGL